MIAIAVLVGLGAAYWIGRRHGLIAHIDAVRMAVMNDPVTELAERLNSLGRGAELHCPKCRAGTGRTVGELPRTPVTAEDRKRIHREARQARKVKP